MSFTRVALLGVIACLCSLAASPTALAASTADGTADRASLSFLVENDSVSGTDRHYTSGLKASWLSKKGDFASFSRWLARALPLFPDSGDRRIGFALGQNIYTPSDLSVTTLQTEDRPYAGWLYGELGLTAQTANRLDSVAISLGVIGPASQADDVQKTWHRMFNITRPRGWEHQLENEPALNITYEHSRRYHGPRTPLLGLGTDLIPHAGGSLGNVFTYGAAGLMARMGRDFAGDFGGPPRIRPSMPGAAHFQPPKSGFGWYLFAGVEGRAVARNIFLDGNTFTDSHSVDKKTFVGDAQLGFALIFERFRITYTQVLRTTEFDGQDNPHHFGALSLTTNF
jgi:hypothetical protein